MLGFFFLKESLVRLLNKRSGESFVKDDVCHGDLTQGRVMQDFCYTHMIMLDQMFIKSFDES